jgi:hypothetical protein
LLLLLLLLLLVVVVVVVVVVVAVAVVRPALARWCSAHAQQLLQVGGTRAPVRTPVQVVVVGGVCLRCVHVHAHVLIMRAS